MTLTTRKIMILFSVLFLVLLIAAPSFAGTAIGWEGESILEKLANSISGPIAKNISILAICLSIGGLMMTGIDFSSWGSRLVFIFLGISVVCFTANWLTKIGVTGAMIF